MNSEGEDFFPPINPSAFKTDGIVTNVSPICLPDGACGIFSNKNEPYVPTSKVLYEAFDGFDQELTKHDKEARTLEANIKEIDRQIATGFYDHSSLNHEKATLIAELNDVRIKEQAALRARDSAYIDEFYIRSRPGIYNSESL